MTETVTSPAGAVSKECSLCGRKARTKRFVSPGGEAYSLCRDCHPETKKGGDTGKVKKRALYSDAVLDLLYRFGGATPRQLARLLVLSVPEIEERDREARRRVNRGERSEASPLPSYSIARSVLEDLRKNGEVETIRLHRAWMSNAGRGRESGRAESFHRFGKGADAREAVLEAAQIAGGKERFEDAQYRLHWSGGAKDDGAYRHSAHRNDLLVQLVESLNPFAGLNPHGAAIDFDAVWGESHPDFPLICSEMEKRNAAGDLKFDASKQKETKYRNSREFERVVPDAVLVIEFGGAVPSAYESDEPETGTTWDGGFDEDDEEGWTDVDTSRTSGGEEVYS